MTKFYVVSEDELLELERITNLRTQTTCRARPVPEWATHFAGGINEVCPVGPDVQTTVLCAEEIKR